MTFAARRPVPWSLYRADPARGSEGDVVHVVLAGFYSFVIWFAALLWLIIADGPVLSYVILSPFIISFGLMLLCLLEFIPSIAKFIVFKAVGLWKMSVLKTQNLKVSNDSLPESGAAKDTSQSGM